MGKVEGEGGDGRKKTEGRVEGRFPEAHATNRNTGIEPQKAVGRDKGKRMETPRRAIGHTIIEARLPASSSQGGVCRSCW